VIAPTRQTPMHGKTCISRRRFIVSMVSALIGSRLRPTFAAGRDGALDYLGRGCGRLLACETRLAQDREELERHGLKSIGRAGLLAFAPDRRIDPVDEVRPCRVPVHAGFLEGDLGVGPERQEPLLFRWGPPLGKRYLNRHRRPPDGMTTR
jgi:hypothetical protein